MPTHRSTCLAVTCDICGTPLADLDDAEVHFTTEDAARAMARLVRWPVMTGGQWICPWEDDAHQAALDALLPDPAALVVGQDPLFDGEVR